MPPLTTQSGPKIVVDASVSGTDRGALERDAKLYAEKLQQEQKADSQSKLAVLTLQPNGAGFLVTREYDDYSSVFPDGRPKYRWSITTWVAADVVSPRPVVTPTTPLKAGPDTATQPTPVDARPMSKDPALIAVNGLAFDKRNGNEVLLQVPRDRPLPLPITQLWPPQGPGLPPAHTPAEMQAISDSFSGTVIVDQVSPETEKRINDAAYTIGTAAVNAGIAAGTIAVNAGIATGTIYVSVQFPMVGLVISGGQGYYTAYVNAQKRGATGADAAYEGLAGAGVGVAISMTGGKIAEYYGGMVVTELAKKGIAAGGEVVGGEVTGAVLNAKPSRVRDPGYAAPDPEKALQMVYDPVADRSLRPEEWGGMKIYR
jgi:hypothetical protein